MYSCRHHRITFLKLPHPSTGSPESADSVGEGASQTAAELDKRDVKALQILSAAAKIFNERGYHSTSVPDVAEALGVSKPFLYYYLKNKDGGSVIYRGRDIYFGRHGSTA